MRRGVLILDACCLTLREKKQSGLLKWSKSDDLQKRKRGCKYIVKAGRSELWVDSSWFSSKAETKKNNDPLYG